MKRLFTFVVTMLLGASLAFAQAGAGSTGQDQGQSQTEGKKSHKSKKGHKGGKKSKKGSAESTTTPPPK